MICKHWPSSTHIQDVSIKSSGLHHFDWTGFWYPFLRWFIQCHTLVWNTPKLSLDSVESRLKNIWLCVYLNYNPVHPCSLPINLSVSCNCGTMRVKLEYVGDEVKDQIKTYKQQQAHTKKKNRTTPSWILTDVFWPLKLVDVEGINLHVETLLIHPPFHPKHFMLNGCKFQHQDHGVNGNTPKFWVILWRGLATFNYQLRSFCSNPTNFLQIIRSFPSIPRVGFA